MNKKILVLPEVYDEVHTGGPLAVVKKMYDLDKKNFDYIKINGIIEREKKGNILIDIIIYLLKYAPIKFLHKYYKLKKFEKNINKINFSKYSKIISHDPIYSYLIIKKGLGNKLVNVYHGQGSLFHEHRDLLNVKGKMFLKNFLEKIELKIFSKSYKIGFPSQGSIEALINTNISLKKIIEKRKDDIIIFYNGINLNPNIKHNLKLEKKIIKNGYNFVTISSLNEAKGVDRIPKFLGGLKRKGINFSWTLVGKGKLSEKIKNEIDKNNIKNESNFFEKGFPKEEILGLLSKTDFYILFHRFSIFDLATLEAMNFGNIPILSNIGGNKEVIIDNNGLLIDENNFGNINLFLNFIEKNNIKNGKEKNKEIIKNNFSDLKFIKRYQDI